ncbi:MAG: hypothetical protein F6J89_18460 [Symploca sp. SIO1C4]|uniref:Ycf66 family protein n=1 Tax=Symploca sp. SIO1C4 TaxID=2607765 RepID=A0A6B3N7F0_9CYAN|nr:hypothetical protein [Symploca sp. SIO1C4]NET07235.1 hypothetical protein [Symploca sp. SIO2B6]NET50602.1 hypothetical protein [Merismopedia sp. SIO2A8]
MLSYVLALAIALGSLAFYLSAFLFPEIHRKQDFYWSGVGMFYALILWVCARRITGGVLLGQLASVSLLCWLGWQTLSLRQELTSPEEKTQISPEVKEKIASFSFADLGGKLLKSVTSLFGKGQSQTEILPKVEESVTAEVEDIETTQELTTTESSTTEVSEPQQAVPPEPAEPQLQAAAQKESSDGTPDSKQKASIPIEEIAPEVELAPPAEPTGDGDPSTRQNPPQ